MLFKNIICFHNPDEENGYLSNWYSAKFQVDNIVFSSMEQYMMYRKAGLFNDSTVAYEILATEDMAEIKFLGRKVSNYDDVIWNGMRQILVYDGLLEKFKQNEGLKNKLSETGEAILAECAVKDKVWGIGLSMKDEDRFDMSKWKGQNLLGFSLMEVRNKMKCLKSTTYNKLIRDKIPEIILKSGKTPVTSILSTPQYEEMLEQKLIEELNEYQESKDIEELADILEVIYAIAKTKGITITDLEAIRLNKVKERGSFDKRILLKEVTEK